MRIPGKKALLRCRWYWRGRLLGGGLILGYHRVAEDPDDPHLLCVRPSHFREQLNVISRHFEVVNLAEIVRRSGVAPESNPDRRDAAEGRRHLALTFDDGYTDVLEAALPSIEDVAVPVTIFVVAGAVGTDRFPWDGDRGGVEGRPLTPSELRQLADRPGVEVGAHTMSHPDLTTLSSLEVRREVTESRDRLEALIGRPVTSFSFPHGGVNRQILETVAEVGYPLACGSQAGLVTEASNPLRLPRLWPPDVPGPAFERWLASWTGIRTGDRVGTGATPMAADTPTDGA